MDKIEYLEKELINYCRTRNWSFRLDVNVTLKRRYKLNTLSINRNSLCQGSGGSVIYDNYINNSEKYDLFFLESICPIILDHEKVLQVKFLFNYMNKDSYYSINENNIFQGKNFCFTGNCKFTSYKRIVNRYGGLVNKEINENTQVLVTGFKLIDESKIEFAKKHNIEIIDELAFRKYLLNNCIIKTT